MSLVDLANFIAILYASIWPLYIAYAARRGRPNVFYISLLLGSAAFVHSLYHLSEFFDLDLMAAAIHTASVLLVFSFGLMLAREEL